MSEPDFARTDLAPPWRSFVVIDVETTGLDDGPRAVSEPRVTELAAVRFDMGVATGVVETFVNPGVSIPAETQAFNGITDAHVANAPEIGEAWRQLCALADGADCAVAFNQPFDRRFIARDVKRARHCAAVASLVGEFDAKRWPVTPLALREPWIDVLSWARKLDRFESGKGRMKLVNVAARWSIVLDKVLLREAHRARADAAATGELWLAMRAQVRDCVKPADLTVANVLRVQSTLEREDREDFQRFVSGAKGAA